MTAANEMQGILVLLDQRHPDWRVGELEIVGRGLGFAVYRCSTAALGPIAVRVPRQRWFENDNDERVDARDLLLQEANLARHMGGFGVPVPAVRSVEFSDEIDLLVSSYVEGDGAGIEDAHLGELTALVHGAAPYPGTLLAQQDSDVDLVIVARLRRRAAVLSDRTGARIGLPAMNDLLAILRSQRSQLRTLHMDIRPANVIARKGLPLALVDWDNALLGPVALEFARIAEYGHLNENFVRGYLRIRDWKSVAEAADIVYRLDTAVMLAVVFASEAPDPARSQDQLERVISLTSQLRQWC